MSNACSCACATLVSLDQSDTSDCWPISDPLINKRRFKAYYLCVHLWMAFTRMHECAQAHSFSSFGWKENTLLDRWTHFPRINQLLKFTISHCGVNCCLGVEHTTACCAEHDCWACKIHISIFLNLKHLEKKRKAVSFKWVPIKENLAFDSQVHFQMSTQLLPLKVRINLFTIKSKNAIVKSAHFCRVGVRVCMCLQDWGSAGMYCYTRVKSWVDTIRCRLDKSCSVWL